MVVKIDCRPSVDRWLMCKLGWSSGCRPRWGAERSYNGRLTLHPYSGMWCWLRGVSHISHGAHRPLHLASDWPPHQEQHGENSVREPGVCWELSNVWDGESVGF
jgi:hypothetical protein